MKLLHTLSEMAAAQKCGNCGQPMSGNHFYRKMKDGSNVRFCKGSAIKAAQDAGLTPNGNKSFPAGGAPASAPAPHAGGSTGAPTSGGQHSPYAGNKNPRAGDPRPKAPRPPAAPKASGGITKQQLEAWLKDVGVKPDEYSVVDGKLNIKTSVMITEHEYTKLPVPFGKVEGDFEVAIPTLESFKNFPSKIGGNLTVYYSRIQNFEELDVTVGGGVLLSKNNELMDYRKVQKHIREVGSGVSVDSLDENTMGGLGFLLIKGIQYIQVTSNSKIEEIMNKHFKEDADLLEVQEELIDSGFKKVARI